MNANSLSRGRLDFVFCCFVLFFTKICNYKGLKVYFKVYESVWPFRNIFIYVLETEQNFLLLFLLENYKNEIISTCWEPKSASYGAYTTLNTQCLGFLCQSSNFILLLRDSARGINHHHALLDRGSPQSTALKM